MNTTYKNRGVRSPFQPRKHPVQQLREKAMDTQNEEHPIRQALRKLCTDQLHLRVSFSEDPSTLSEIKVPGLIAVKCVISDANGKPLGIGHSSSYLTRINRQQERTLFTVLNGSLLSGMNAVCKSLDALRLEQADEGRTANKASIGEAYRASDSENSDSATPKQRDYLRQLLQVQVSDEERDHWMPNMETLTRSEASELISRYATR